MCHQMQIEGLYLGNAPQNLLFQFLVKLWLLIHFCHHFKRPIYRNVTYNKMCSHIDIELEASLLRRSTIPISTDKPLLISPPSIHPVLDEPTPLSPLYKIFREPWRLARCPLPPSLPGRQPADRARGTQGYKGRGYKELVGALKCRAGRC